MRAARIHAFDGVVHVDEVDAPAPSEGEMLVRLRAVAANPLDLWVAEGSVAGGSQPLPFVLGTEGVGVVGDRRVVVNGSGLGTTRDGLLREAAAVPSELLVDVPNAVDDDQAAALSVAGITAKRILEVANVEAGAIVVVLGASGGAGSVAVQVARLLSARVVAVTGSADKRGWLEGLEPDLVLAGSEAPEPKALTQTFGRLADTVLNPLGGEFVGSSVDLLVAGGRQVLFGRSAGDAASFSAAALYRKNVSILGYGGLDDAPDRKHAARAWIFEQIAAGRLAIPVEARVPLERVGEAFDLIRSRAVRGKVIVRIHEP